MSFQSKTANTAFLINTIPNSTLLLIEKIDDPMLMHSNFLGDGCFLYAK